jgi:hypothetical protein
MLASSPASILNQMFAPLGIPRDSVFKLDALREITRSQFLQSIKPDVAIYSAWALREEGTETYCRKIRALHFSSLNVDHIDRFFILTLPDSHGLNEVSELTHHIISNGAVAKPRKTG